MDYWELACNRCGLCCFEKTVDARGRFRTTRVACRHLDIVSRECRVYAKRLAVGAGCVKLTPEIVRSADWLPANCAYRAISGRGTRDEEREEN
jgi:uncharacterized cysteine cluster protein YcgN (CxxCxxCC family)